MSNMPRQLTEDECVAFGTGGEWQNWSDDQIGAFQLFQDRLCVPIDVFHRCIEVTLGRPVFNIEFCDIQRLRDEYLGKRPEGTFADVLRMVEERGFTPVVVANGAEGER